MFEVKKDNKKIVGDIANRVFKAAVKAVIVFALYVFFVPLLWQISGFIPNFAETIQTFVIVYIVLMVIGELTARTILQHAFSIATSLLVMFFLIFSMGDGTVSINVQNLDVMVNVTAFFTIALALSLLGLAKSMLQTINYLARKAETSSIIAGS